jgi:hypothetical protein
MRRALSFCALLGYLVGQLAAVPHAHCGAEDVAHARPHLHLSGPPHHHVHPHDEHLTHDPDGTSGKLVAFTGQPVPGNHDHGVVYLADSAPVVRQHAPKCHLLMFSTTLCLLPRLLCESSAEGLRRRRVQSDRPVDGRHRFLELGCLLI